MTEEFWKEIEEGREGIYWVSNLGRVKSLHGGVERMLSLRIDKEGYRRVSLYNREDKRVERRVHRLVATAFLPNPDNKPIVCHIIPINDGGTDAVDNIYWGTQQENDSDRTANGSINKRKPRTGPIYQLDLETGEVINTYSTIDEAAKAINRSPRLLGKTIREERTTCGGYGWSRPV